MEVIYGLIPGMVILGLVGVAVFIWAARSGQFDDMEGDASRILMDEDEEAPERVSSSSRELASTLPDDQRSSESKGKDEPLRRTKDLPGD